MMMRDSEELGPYIHPIDKRECQVVIGGDYITTETGTGLVHTAPGHGQEDYATGLKYGLPLISPVDDDGKFTEEAGQFSGLDVLGDGNTAVVKYLDDHFSLILEESYGKAFTFQLISSQFRTRDEQFVLRTSSELGFRSPS
ncbi:Isoleucine--tRNA ligase, chloroplastic/mitochondrial, partial [Cucurbita argyrosperma subsp. argyrosperma]